MKLVSTAPITNDGQRDREVAPFVRTSLHSTHLEQPRLVAIPFPIRGCAAVIFNERPRPPIAVSTQSNRSSCQWGFLSRLQATSENLRLLGKLSVKCYSSLWRLDLSTFNRSRVYSRWDVFLCLTASILTSRSERKFASAVEVNPR